MDKDCTKCVSYIDLTKPICANAWVKDVHVTDPTKPLCESRHFKAKPVRRLSEDLEFARRHTE